MECRVCRGGEEEGERPLVAPCLCSGSILLCHQECLEEWLQHSNRKSCELCNTIYNFKAVYSDNMPEKLPSSTLWWCTVRKFIVELCPFFFRLSLVMFLWLGLLPLLTTWLYRLWLHRGEGDSMFSLISIRCSPEAIQDDVVNGIIIAGVIALSFLVLMSFTDFLAPPRDGNFGGRGRNNNNNAAAIERRRVEEEINNLAMRNIINANQRDRLLAGDRLVELQRNQQDRAADGGIPPANVLPPPPIPPPLPRPVPPLGNVDNNNNNNNNNLGAGFDDFDFLFDNEDLNEGLNEGEIQIALDELLGLRGHLSLLIRNILWLLAFNGAYIGLFAFIPMSIGSTVYSFFGPNIRDIVDNFHSYLVTHDSVLATFLTDVRTIIASKDSIIQMGHVLRITLGFQTMASIVLLIGELIFSIHKFVPLHMMAFGYVVEALNFSRQILKSGFLLFIRIFCIPILLGFAVIYNINFLTDYTREETLKLVLENVIGFFSLGWVLGICFMLFVMLCFLQVREVVHPRFLASWIKPQEAQKDLLASLINDPVLLHIRRVIISVGVYVILLILFVVGPVHVMLAYIDVICWLFGYSVNEYTQVFKIRLWYGNQKLQMPLELLIAHICLLTCTERHKDIIGKMQHIWLRYISQKLGLTRFLLPVVPLDLCEDCKRCITKEIRCRECKRLYQEAGINTDTVDEGEPPIAPTEGPSSLSSSSTTTATATILVATTTEPEPEAAKTTANNSTETKVTLIELQIDGYTEDVLYGYPDEATIKSWGLEHKYRFSDALERPPEGWETQRDSARWAFGEEPKSHVEASLAPRFIPSFWFIRMIVLLVCSWFTLVNIILVCAFGPIYIGRVVIECLRFPIQYHHDPFCMLIGVKLIWKFTQTFLKNKTQIYLAFQAVSTRPTSFYIRHIFQLTYIPVALGICTRLIGDFLVFWSQYLPAVPIINDVLSGNLMNIAKDTCIDDISRTYFSTYFKPQELISMLISDWKLGFAIIVASTLAPKFDVARLIFRLRRVAPDVAPDDGVRAREQDVAGVDRFAVENEHQGEAAVDLERGPGVVMIATLEKLINYWYEFVNGLIARNLFFHFILFLGLGSTVFFGSFYNLDIMLQGDCNPPLDAIRLTSHISCVISCFVTIIMIFRDQIKSILKRLVDGIRDDNYLIGKQLQSSPQGKMKLQQLRSTNNSDTEGTKPSEENLEEDEEEEVIAVPQD